MRWTLTSPDGIGDFLLRLPWLFEMERRGWALQLLAREPTIEAARLFGLGGEFVPLGVSPYSKRSKEKGAIFKSEFRLARAFAPDLVFLGPSQPSMLEEHAVEHFRDIPLGGFVLNSEFWPSESIADPRKIAEQLSITVPVRESDSEPARNALAAGVLLGGKVELQACRLGTEALGEYSWSVDGLAEGRYLVVSPGYREGDYFKGLGVERWGRELRELENATDLVFVFVGSATEKEFNGNIFSRLSKQGRHRDLTGEIARLSELAALLRCSQAYVGKDSGAMHLAAALEKPIVAVFGGGHRSRFFPAGSRSVVLTVDVPCRGCDWRCHLEEPLCVTDLNAGSVLRAWVALAGLASGEMLVWEQAPSDAACHICNENPQGSFPKVAHEKRKAEFTRLRDQAGAPWQSRIWRRLRQRSLKSG